MTQEQFEVLRGLLEKILEKLQNIDQNVSPLRTVVDTRRQCIMTLDLSHFD